MDREEILLRPSRPYVEHIFLELESINAYFEVTHIDEYKNLTPSIFCMPEKPLCMVKKNNCLARLGIGKCITGYWLKQEVRFKIPYKEE